MSQNWKVLKEMKASLISDTIFTTIKEGLRADTLDHIDPMPDIDDLVQLLKAAKAFEKAQARKMEALVLRTDELKIEERITEKIKKSLKEDKFLENEKELIQQNKELAVMMARQRKAEREEEKLDRRRSYRENRGQRRSEY